ncbi:pituitary tumor-transforming gene 1 protein-interacting protein-like [Littorina saxatilis]|uniref:Uncharacterized protein n=1 Tax=Littorina saxatilis TaxID=31220 RepID=A0AAN9BNL5_9CAEN
MKYLRFASIVLLGLSVIAGQTGGVTGAENVTTDSPDQTTTPTKSHDTTQNPVVTSTLTPAEMCAQFSNGTCDQCLGVAGAKCLWCNSDKSCQLYPYKKVLPPKGMCALDEARWGVCWLNFEALIIGVSVTGGIIILAVTICICRCCCCGGKNKRKYDKDDARYDAQKMERKAKSDDRKSERKERLDEIRRKYGLMKDEPYQRFDA